LEKFAIRCGETTVWWAESFAKAILVAAESTRNKAGGRRE